MSDVPSEENKKPYVEPDPRVLFAAERNLLAWIRTGLALMGFGFVAARFGLLLKELGLSQVVTRNASPGISLIAGVVLVVLGVFINVIAIRQHLFYLNRINRGESLFPSPASPGVVVAAVLALFGLLLALYLAFSAG